MIFFLNEYVVNHEEGSLNCIPYTNRRSIEWITYEILHPAEKHARIQDDMA